MLFAKRIFVRSTLVFQPKLDSLMRARVGSWLGIKVISNSVFFFLYIFYSKCPFNLQTFP